MLNERQFRIVLPDGTIKTTNYNGEKVDVIL
jgi:hypothetical protein